MNPLVCDQVEQRSLNNVKMVDLESRFPNFDFSAGKFITIDHLIKRLQEVREKEGNLIVTINDEQVGYIPSISVTIRNTEGYTPSGFFTHKKGDQKICLIDYSY